ncbi:MAG TPA: recombinase family protein, partial [Terriglobales bacterium]
MNPRHNKTPKRIVRKIAKRLNKKGLRNIRGHLWSAENIHCLLTNPIYIGRSIWGRTTQKLRTKPVERTPWLVPLDSAIPIPGGAFIKLDDFAKLQSVLTSRSRRTSNEELIRKGKEILRKGGNLSAKIIKKNHMAEKTIRSHFGSVAEYYDVLGYKHPSVLHYQRERLRETIRLREKLAYRLVQLWPSSNVEVQQIGVRTAVRLDGCQVHVKTCRYRPSYAGVARQWTWISSLRLPRNTGRLNRTRGAGQWQSEQH